MNTSFSYLYPVDNFSLVYLTYLLFVCKALSVALVVDLVYNSCYNRIQYSCALPIDKLILWVYNACIKGIGANTILITST